MVAVVPFLKGIADSASGVARGAFGLEKAQVTAQGALGPETVVLGAITILLGFLGVIFLVLMIYGGWLWMTAQGNEEQTTKARKIIFDAIIGLLILAAAYIITVVVGAYIFESAGFGKTAVYNTGQVETAP